MAIAVDAGGKKAVQVVRQQRHCEVEVGLGHYAGRVPVHMEEIDLLANALLDEPAPGVLANDLMPRELEVVSDHGGDCGSARALDKNLPHRAVIAGQRGFALRVLYCPSAPVSLINLLEYYGIFRCLTSGT